MIPPDLTGIRFKSLNLRVTLEAACGPETSQGAALASEGHCEDRGVGKPQAKCLLGSSNCSVAGDRIQITFKREIRRR